MKVERKELESVLIEILPTIKTKKDMVSKYKDLMAEFKVLGGRVQSVLNDPEKEVPQLDDKELYVFSVQLYMTTGNQRLNPDHFYNEREKKEIETTFTGYQAEEIKFPYTFKSSFEKLHDGYTGKISVTEMRLLSNGKQIQYNPNVQRSGKVKQVDDETFIPVPKIFRRSIEGIKNRFLKGKLSSTTLTFNARLGSSDDGEEISYDEDTKELTITKGTLFDCIDGFHRFTATVEGQHENPNKDMEFIIKIQNLTDAEAKEVFVEINTFNDITTSRMKEMDQEKLSTVAVEFLKKSGSELKEKITSENTVKSDELTTFGILVDAVEEFFEMENRGQAIKTGQYLTKYFNNLCYSFPDEFISDIKEIRYKSEINRPTMFYGFVCLAKRMQDEGIEIELLSDIVKDIDFNKENWQELKGKSPAGIRKHIKEVFENIDLSKYKVGV
ncbi:hypothetical protein [Halalkalibacter oceani]|uniref:hypothetical protein n=1 Tax=Halalkalibacter oceani TaxID=1653776 RepID=UPI0033966874